VDADEHNEEHHETPERADECCFEPLHGLEGEVVARATRREGLLSIPFLGDKQIETLQLRYDTV
jgi:hypothetical protein